MSREQQEQSAVAGGTNSAPSRDPKHSFNMWWIATGTLFAIAATCAVFGLGVVTWGRFPATGTGLLQVAAAAAAVGAGVVAIGGQRTTAAQLQRDEAARISREWNNEVRRAGLVHAHVSTDGSDFSAPDPHHGVPVFVINHSRDVVTDVVLLLARKDPLGGGLTGGLTNSSQQLITTATDWRNYRSDALDGEDSSFGNLPSRYQGAVLPALPAGGLAIIRYEVPYSLVNVTGNQYTVVLEYTDVRGRRWECETDEVPRLASEFDENGKHRWFRTTLPQPFTDHSTAPTD